jgi:sugar phosphate isomerase/epimerase
MYSYAGSFPFSIMAQESWQQAFANAALKKVEISSGDFPNEEAVAASIPGFLKLQESGAMEAASLHLPFAPFGEIDCSSLDEKIRKNTVLRLSRFIEYFRPLHIPNITLHCSCEPIEAPRSARVSKVHQTCLELLPLLESVGASLNLELLPRSCVGNTVEELLEILDGLPQKHFGICLDVNHGMDRGREVPRMIQQCGERLKTLHISDYDNRDECHWNVGEGMLDWAAIQDALKQVPQNLTVIIEVKHLSVPEWKGYSVAPEFIIKNVERNCMMMEYHQEIAALLEKTRTNGFKQTL